jgi:polyhydroxyalkanoate synthesis regulator phasin
MLDECSPMLVDPQKKAYLDGWVDMIYDESASIFENVRSINEDIRDEANRQITCAEDRADDLESEVTTLEQRISELEGELDGQYALLASLGK